MRTVDTDTYDAVVVGARVAGSATALHLARRGHRVLVVDRARFPSDTLSTHALARTGVVQLHRWGLLDAVLASGAPAIRQVVFHRAGASTSLTVKDRHGVDHVIAPRRQVLDQILVDAAAAAGAEIREATTVTDVVRDGSGRVTGVTLRTPEGTRQARGRIVIGADGLRSGIARRVGAPIVEAHAAGGAVHYAYFRGDWPAMEYYAADGGSAGIFPTHDADACIWVSNPADTARRQRRANDDLVGAFESLVAATTPELLPRLSAARRTSPVHGMVGLPNHRRRPVGDGWALVGDAAYHRDAITGHGISDAFRDAELLADALHRTWTGAADEGAALDGYAAEQHRLMREIFDLTLAFVEFPPADRFIELQKDLGRAIERQAAELATWDDAPATPVTPATPAIAADPATAVA
jgi:2-polyprenyl-6-methoxyphenol hydroxylase-like FAD-dependent oxidoreductase